MLPYRYLCVAVLAALPVGFISANDPSQEVAPPEVLATLELTAAKPKATAARRIVIGIPDLGPKAGEHLSFAILDQPGTDTPPKVVQATGWLQQERMQPSHISKQKREITISSLGWEGKKLNLKFSAVLTAPKQLGQQPVREEFSGDLALEPAKASDLPALRSPTSAPPWRRHDIPYQGQPLLGEGEIHFSRQKGTAEPITGTLKRRVGGSWQYTMSSGTWITRGDAHTTVTETPEGVHFHVDMPAEPSPAYEEGGARIQLAREESLEGANAIVVTYTSSRVKGAHWKLSLQEGPGVWYSYGMALPMVGEKRTVLLPFRAFRQAGGFDMDYWFNAPVLEGIGFAAQSGFGIGPVEITIHKVEIVRTPDAPRPEVTVVLEPQHLISTNGQSKVPEGIFGVHTVWKPKQEALAKLPESGVRSLRPIIHQGFGSKAPNSPEEFAPLSEALGGEVAEHSIISYTGAPLMSPAPWRTGRGIEEVEMDWAAFGTALGQASLKKGHPLATTGRAEIWNEPFMWARYVNKNPSKLDDPEQAGYLPGPMLTEGYTRLFKALASAADEVNPELQLGGPSSASFNSDGWRHLTQHVLPFVIEAGDHLDFVTEHHYMGRPQQFSASFEVFQAMATKATGRRIPIWNTEANELIDQPGARNQPENFHADGVSQRRFAYNLADMLLGIKWHNDVVIGRAIHALWRGEFRYPGEAMAYNISRNLRGNIFKTQSDDPDIIVVGARTDKTGSVVAFNDGPRAKTVSFTGEIPPFLTYEIVSLGDSGLHHQKEQVGTVLNGQFSVSIPPLSAVALHFENLPSVDRLTDQTIQYAYDKNGRGGLWWLGPGEILELEMKPGPGALTDLRFVSEGNSLEQVKVTLHGKAGAQPQSFWLPPADQGPLSVQSVPVAQSEATKITLEATKESGWIAIRSIAGVWSINTSL